MDKEKAIKKLMFLIQSGDEISKSETSDSSQKFKEWFRNTEVSLENIFTTDSHLKALRNVEFSLPASSVLYGATDKEFTYTFRSSVKEATSILKVAKDEIEEFWEDTKESISNDSSIEKIELLISKFHSISKQLTERYDGRETLKIEDEYDVQDLFHSLLKIYFDDVRPEEYTPSYAASSSRVDFLLKNEKIVIEIKKTRKNLKAKKLGEQLIIDIARYESHPDCNHLVCFTYDPEGYIKNPSGIENDLSNTDKNRMLVSVFIEPK